jgi:hypothetical protein
VITPDDKDWTWTLERECPECGFAAGDVARGDIAQLVLSFTSPWPGVLAGSAVRSRPDEATWSPLEYGAHVRDVCRVFTERVTLMREEDEPSFANWDQDRTAVEDDYAGQDPGVVANEILTAATGLSAVYESIGAEEWDRTGLRSDGSRFTVLTLGQYLLHDLRHHLWDVGAEPVH